MRIIKHSAAIIPLLSVLLFSCSKPDSNRNSGGMDGKFTFNGGQNSVCFTFKSDGKVSVHILSAKGGAIPDEAGTYKLDGEKVIMNFQNKIAELKNDRGLSLTTVGGEFPPGLVFHKEQ